VAAKPKVGVKRRVKKSTCNFLWIYAGRLSPEYLSLPLSLVFMQSMGSQEVWQPEETGHKPAGVFLTD